MSYGKLGLSMVAAMAFGAGCASTSPTGTTYSDSRLVSAFAIGSTRIEPAPTSYVLFPSFVPPVYTEGEPVDPYVDRLRALERAHLNRVEAYCVGHFRAFLTEAEARTANPYGNTIPVFWLVNDRQAELSGVIDARGERVMDLATLQSRCEALAKDYDFGRADRMLATFSGMGGAEVKRGPLFVLDLGDEAVLLNRDAASDTEMPGLAAVWLDRVRQAERDALASEQSLLSRRAEVGLEIEALKAKSVDRNLTKSARRAARKELEKKREEQADIERRLFGRGSTERRLACRAGEWLAELSGLSFLRDGVIRSTVDEWCEAEPDGSSSN